MPGIGFNFSIFQMIENQTDAHKKCCCKREMRDKKNRSEMFVNDMDLNFK